MHPIPVKSYIVQRPIAALDFVDGQSRVSRVRVDDLVLGPEHTVEHLLTVSIDYGHSSRLLADGRVDELTVQREELKHGRLSGVEAPQKNTELTVSLRGSDGPVGAGVGWNSWRTDARIVSVTWLSECWHPATPCARPQQG